MSEPWLHGQLRRHGERFRCAICGVPSRAPAYERMEGLRHAWSNWNRPGDLYWCRDCGRHVCAAHDAMDVGYCSDYIAKRYPSSHERV